MKRTFPSLLSVLFLFFMLFYLPTAQSESGDSLEHSNLDDINLYDLSIDELLSLQSHIQTVLADKGYAKYSELERGSKGDGVLSLQERLKELGYYQGAISGKYDSETQKAFKSFEKNNNLQNDGKASQADQTLLYSSQAIPRSTPTAEPVLASHENRQKEVVPDGYVSFSEFDYTEYFRYPEKYYGTQIVLKGKVVQVLGSRSRGFEIRFSTSNNYDDIVYIRIKNDPGFNILEGDRLTVYATMKNTYTYTSTWGNSVTIPSADANNVELN